MTDRSMATISALQAAGISYGGACQLMQAQLLSTATDRQKLAHILSAVLTRKLTSAPSGTSSVFSTRAGIRMQMDDNA